MAIDQKKIDEINKETNPAVDGLVFLGGCIVLAAVILAASNGLYSFSNVNPGSITSAFYKHNKLTGSTQICYPKKGCSDLVSD